MGAFPETGRDNLLQDVIASSTGQSSVKRYFPRPPSKDQATDAHANALLQVAGMKVGVPPVVTSTQNPVIYAQTFLQAGAQAASSLQQIQNPEELIPKEAEVAQFLDLIGAGTQAHIERMSTDPTRKQVVDALSQQWKQLAKFSDQLHQKIQHDVEAQQKQKEQQMAELQKQMANGQADPRIQAEIEALKRKTESELQLAKAGLEMDKEVHQMKIVEMRQGLSIADAHAATDIATKKRETESKIKLAEEAAEANIKAKAANERFKVKKAA
jgi:hypothetical protein